MPTAGLLHVQNHSRKGRAFRPAETHGSPSCLPPGFLVYYSRRLACSSCFSTGCLLLVNTGAQNHISHSVRSAKCREFLPTFLLPRSVVIRTQPSAAAVGIQRLSGVPCLKWSRRCATWGFPG